MAEIKKMHALIEKYQLKGQVRWIAAQTDRYRYIADTKGAFVQSALSEAFGLTVIEAMNCGLPTFATNQGGPAEIIVDGVSGFHIDPNNGDESSSKIADFFEKCKTDSRYWNIMSQAIHGRSMQTKSSTWDQPMDSGNSSTKTKNKQSRDTYTFFTISSSGNCEEFANQRRNHTSSSIQDSSTQSAAAAISKTESRGG
ncbi:sucrose synthase 6 [Perilla frutescens var. hirtella]|nr:sucrose synthase 6 [Perilla frutescens var. hirtella]